MLIAGSFLCSCSALHWHPLSCSYIFFFTPLESSKNKKVTHSLTYSLMMANSITVLSKTDDNALGLLSSGAREATFFELFSFKGRVGHLIVEACAVLEVVFPIVLHSGCLLS